MPQNEAAHSDEPPPVADGGSPLFRRFRHAIRAFLGRSEDASHVSVYLVDDLVLIPTAARTDAGFYLDVEPVERLDRASAEELATALGRVFARGHPHVLTPNRRAFPAWILPRYANARDEADFTRRARLWTVTRTADAVLLTPSIGERVRGFRELPERAESIPDGDLLLAARRLLAMFEEPA